MTYQNKMDDETKERLDNARQEAFLQMVNAYKANGIRMVAIDFSESCSCLMAFDTNGVNASRIDKRRFLDNGVLEYAKSCGCGARDLRQVFDVTDDADEMLGGYDYASWYPIHTLVEVDMTGVKLGVDKYDYCTKPGWNDCPVCGKRVTRKYSNPLYFIDHVTVEESCPHCHSIWYVTYDYHHVTIYKDGRFNEED